MDDMNTESGAGAVRTVLVIEDDEELAALLSDYLGREGFAVRRAQDGHTGLALAAAGECALVLLDIMLPGRDGVEVLRELRRVSAVPVIMLTAKGDEVDRIVGLELGADDYLPKPFNPRELVARIHAVLRRRAAPLPPGAPALETGQMRFGPVTVDLATRALTRAGKTISLTTGEFGLLKVLLAHPRVPLSRDKLMELARGREYEVFDRAIDVQISRLRKLVEPDPAHPVHIQTVWGFGYVFVPDGKA
jgi:two-component system phosphate regulon response regulator OmpR